jgi:hypothetical protein
MLRIPKMASIDLNGFRQAGTFRLQFDYVDMPIDPRLLRAAAVDIHIDAIIPDAFGQGMVTVEQDGSRRSVLTPTIDNLVLHGVIDTAHVEHTSGQSMLSVEGRDLRAIFLDSPLPVDMVTNLKLDQPIDDVVKQILQKHPQAKLMNIKVQPDDWGSFEDIAGLPSPGTKDKLTRVRRGAGGDRSVSAPQGPPEVLNYWTLITQYCFLVGAIPFFVGKDLHIRPARSIHDQLKAGINSGTGSTPFKDGRPRTVDGVGQFTVRKLAYGRDVLSFTFERKYTGFKPQIVRCVSIDTSSKNRGGQKLIEAQWPTRATLEQVVTQSLGGTAEAQKLAKETVRATFGKISKEQTKAGAQAKDVSPSGRASSSEFLTIPVPGIRDKDRLQQVAQDIYEEIGRGEMGGAIQTRSLASFGGDNQDPDLLRLRPGDGVELVVDSRALSSSAPAASYLLDNVRQSFDDRVRSLTAAFGDADIARAVVASSTNSVVELQQFFRVSNVKFDWSMTGLAIAFDFQNYVVARNQLTPSMGANQQPVKIKTAKGLVRIG